MLKFIIFVIFLDHANSYKILGIFPFPLKSHFLTFDPLMIELANRGHNVTVYNTFPKKYTIANYNDVDISNCFGPSVAWDINQMKEVGVNRRILVPALLQYVPKYAQIINCEPITSLWNSSEKYDLLIVEMCHNDIFMLFGKRFDVPIVAFHSHIPLPWHHEVMGLLNSPSYLPVEFSGYTSKMNFFQRLINAWLHFEGNFYYEIGSRRVLDEIAPKIFNQSVPKMKDLANGVNLWLFNTHYSINWAMPLAPNVKEVGGLMIQKSKPLPKNIEKFINESKHGVVYFCMGSLLRGETFPPEKREAFLYAFSKIAQRVLWKWEGDVLPGKSDDIMISKWMPQRDILAHPNVKLFISHGGLLGMSEAVYEGVPILGIPIVADQRTNIKSLEANGAGELLDYNNEISNEVVLEKIQRLLNDPKYKENAKVLSDRYRDRPMSPLDTAVYWTEYVIRHKGAPHLRTAAADMPWYQYLLLDVIAFVVAVLVAGLLIIYYATKFILKAIYGFIHGPQKGSSKLDEKVKCN
ncbi:UDP-glycosyltransferase UGT5-like [Planococcus citri]|uniref:UDP-glycosyltransferase UGT5-like n=1 Tax=Planococcus citri TaxID=170843 RepID=UPI0031F86843